MPDNSQHAKRRAFAAALMLVAGLIHLVLAVPHLQEARGAGLFFLSLAGAQIVWAVMMINHRTKRLERLGTLALAVAPSILFVMTRVVRAPFGAGPETVDVMGLMAIILQIGVIVSLWGAAPKWHAQNASRYAAAGLALALVAYGGAIAAENIEPLAEGEGPHGHDETASNEAMMEVATNPASSDQPPDTAPVSNEEEDAHGH